MIFRNIKINNTIYKFTVIKRKGIKNIRLKIDRDGFVKVSLPWYIPKSEAKNYLIKNTKWLEKNFNLLNNKKNEYFYLGSKIKITEIIDSKYLSIEYKFDNGVFYIRYNGNLKIEPKEIYHHWLRKEAKKYIPRETQKIAAKYNFKYNRISIKNMTSRWGSCSTKKNLSFNLKLMYFKPKIIEYVIVHELCHLKEMNHSKNFWLLVENIIPDYKICRKKLKSFYN